MQFAAAGDRAVLVSGPDFRPPAGLKPGPHVLAAIPGHESLLVVCDGAPDVNAIARWLEDASEGAGIHSKVHRLNVAFDGMDFDEFLSRVGISRDEFLARVGDVRLSVRYLGFRPGFAYCDGWPEAWRLPRRATSRNRVPRNTFAIAGEMAGIYPDDLPGGWNLLGTTDAQLWDPTRQPPNLLQPGDEIAIHPVPTVIVPPPAVILSGAKDLPPIGEVLSAGQLTTIVGPRDWRLANAGVSPGGPFDAVAAALANRAVGNADDAPLLECVLVTPTLRLDRRAAFCDSSLVVRDFTTPGRIPFRGYVAIEGGVAGEGVVRKGDVLRSLECGGSPPLFEIATRAAASCRTPDTIRVLPGPHPAPPLPREWEVTKELNRVGIRLRPVESIGELVSVALPADLPSCGMQFGTLQWHPDGSLLAMGPDHPVTGGYLQPATLLSSELWKLAQLAPGERVTLIAE